MLTQVSLLQLQLSDGFVAAIRTHKMQLLSHKHWPGDNRCLQSAAAVGREHSAGVVLLGARSAAGNENNLGRRTDEIQSIPPWLISKGFQSFNGLKSVMCLGW